MNWLKHNKILVAAVIVFHLVFFIAKVFLGEFYTNDSYEYLQLAENIKNHFTFYSADLNQAINIQEYTKRPPVYGLFVLLTSFSLKSKITLLFAQNLLSISSILLTLWVLGSYFKKVNKWIYLIMVLGTFTPFVYSNFIMSETLFQFLMVLLCYLFFKITAQAKLKYLLWFQLVIILLFLTKPVFYLFVIPNLFLGIWFSKYFKKSLPISFIPLIVAFLYMSWNKSRTGHFEFSSIQTVNLVNYNLLYFHLNTYGEDYALATREAIFENTAKLSTYSERQKTKTKLALEYIKKDFFKYFLFHLKGSIRMLFDPGRYDVYHFFQFEKTNEVGFLKHLNSGGISGAIDYYLNQPLAIVIILPLILILNFIKAIGFLLFCVKNYTCKSPIIWFSMFLMLYIIGLTGPLGSTRFMLPILTLYCFFAAQGFLKKTNLRPAE